MAKKGAVFLLIALIAALPQVFAVCTGTDSCTLNIKNPSGTIINSCSITITPTGETDCNQQSNPSCQRTATCAARGIYTADMAAACHINGVSPTSMNILTCDYDSCSNCCTSGTSYTWGLAGDYTLQSCCGDDASDFYQAADIGAINLCCNSASDCAINGACITSGQATGNYCCYGTSSVDQNKPACATYSSGATCYYNGVAQCTGTGWQCSYSSKTCGAGTACTDTCGAETCHRTNAGAWDYGIPPATETACTDTYNNDCEDGVDLADSDCGECASGPCCNTSSFPYTFYPAGTVCDNTDVCSGQSLCNYMACDATGNCNTPGGCSACAGRTTGQCGIATGQCTSQAGDDVCEFTDDVSLCASCDDECNAAFMCTPIATSPCCYTYSECVAVASDPKIGEEPSDISQCLCHTLFQNPNCI